MAAASRRPPRPVRPEHFAPLGTAIAADLQAAVGDTPHALALAYYPAPLRAPALSMIAVCVELAQIEARVREPMLRAIRYQWWRDALTAPTPQPGPPALAALLATVPADSAPRQALIEHVDAVAVGTADPLAPDAALCALFIDGTDPTPVLAAAALRRTRTNWARSPLGARLWLLGAMLRGPARTNRG